MESDFNDISSINGQQAILSKYMTSNLSVLQNWMQQIGYSADDFAQAMQSVKESLDRVSAVSEAKAAILGVSDQYQLAKNEKQWGLATGSLSDRDKQQEQVDRFLNMSSESIVEWTDAMGLNTADFITNVQQMADNLKSTNDEFESVVKTLDDYKKRLLGQDSMLSPDVIFRQKLADWNSNLTDMSSPDAKTMKEALDKFPDLSDSLLEAAKRTMTDQYAYSQLWGKIYTETEKASTTTQSQITQSTDEHAELMDKWNELITVDVSSNEVLQKQHAAQGELALQVSGFAAQIDTLAKSEDFDTFFSNFNILFSAESGWVVSLRTAITSVYDSIESGKTIFPPIQTLMESINNTLLLSVAPSAPETVPTSVNNYYINNTGHDDPAQESYALMYQNMYRGTGIRGYAEGGYHEGGLAMVGELGPELIHVGASKVYSNNETKSLLSNTELIQESKKPEKR
ncbi:hypothetical protein MCHI_002186 [Candidatus Magnetoovum chiemensis]|nr:hypothetical protein MCHI_002186 [Candidatus Magnetoovum chiemensis]